MNSRHAAQCGGKSMKANGVGGGSEGMVVVTSRYTQNPSISVRPVCVN
jgi:hypothetical protein